MAETPLFDNCLKVSRPGVIRENNYNYSVAANFDVLLIADKHSLVPVQKNMARFLVGLVDQWPHVALVAAESDIGPIDPSIHYMGDAQNEFAKLELDTKNGRLKGHEIAAILRPELINIFGIENAELYTVAYQTMEWLLARQSLCRELQALFLMQYGSGISAPPMTSQWIHLPTEVRRAGEFLNFCRLSATPTELQEVIDHKKVQSWADAAMPHPIPEYLIEMIDMALVFYRNVRQRDSAYVERIAAIGMANPGKTVAFVVGDLHVPNVYRLLKPIARELVFWDPLNGWDGSVSSL